MKLKRLESIKEFGELIRIQQELTEFKEMMELIKQYPTKSLKRVPSPQYDILKY